MKYSANSFSFNGRYELQKDKRWLINSYEFVRQIAIFDTHRTILALNFLLCLHSCTVNENKSRITNDNYSHLRAKPSGTSGAI